MIKLSENDKILSMGKSIMYIEYFKPAIYHLCVWYCGNSWMGEGNNENTMFVVILGDGAFMNNLHLYSQIWMDRFGQMSHYPINRNSKRERGMHKLLLEKLFSQYFCLVCISSYIEVISE